MYSVTKGFTFDMGHRLTFHSNCYNLHGHTYRLEVTVEGPLDSDGIVLDFSEVKRKVNELVIAELDHSFICYSQDTLMKDFLATTDFRVVMVDFETTAENLARWVYDRLVGDGLNVTRVTLFETPNSRADFIPAKRKSKGEV